MALTVWNDKTVSGQYAGLVAASWKGKTYIRSAPSKVNNNSPKQQWHKKLYKFAYLLISPHYTYFIKKYFNSPKMTPANCVIKNLSQMYWKANTYREACRAFRYPYTGLNAECTWTFTRTADLKAMIGTRTYFAGQDIEQATKFIFIAISAFEDTISVYTERDIDTTEFIWELPEKTIAHYTYIYYAVANEDKCSMWKYW